MPKHKHRAQIPVEDEQEAPREGLQAYVVIHSVSHRGKLYKFRDILYLTEAEAATWVKRQYIAVVDLTETED